MNINKKNKRDPKVPHDSLFKKQARKLCSVSKHPLFSHPPTPSDDTPDDRDTPAVFRRSSCVPDDSSP